MPTPGCLKAALYSQAASLMAWRNADIESAVTEIGSVRASAVFNQGQQGFNRGTL